MDSKFVSTSTLFAATAANLISAVAHAAAIDAGHSDPLYKLREQARADFMEKCGVEPAAQLPWSQFDQETLQAIIFSLQYNIQSSCYPTEMENMPGTAKNQGDGELPETKSDI
jgi:hypothetical protein